MLEMHFQVQTQIFFFRLGLKHGAIMIFTPGFSLAVTIAESAFIQLVISSVGGRERKS